MSNYNGNDLQLTGTGAAYIRVSDDQQDTERQYSAVRAFEKKHGVSISKHHWYEDEGWARDTADDRPAFQQLMKQAENGVISWIVVSERDRFGTKDADEFIHFRYQLRKWGCRLFDANGTDWTRKDIATVITAVVDGEKSEQEQHGLSKRVLGSKVGYVRAGEWQGGPVCLGFDVVCYPKKNTDKPRKPDEELWRVVIEGDRKRVKVFPDGRSERFDGPNNFPKFQEQTEILQLAPSKDKAKIAAAVSVFKRYATESISFTALAHYLNALGYRNGRGGLFQPQQVENLLGDPVFMGLYTFNRRHFGKFHKWSDGQTVLDVNYAEKMTKNDKADWVQSHRLFEPLVGLKTWNAVQAKLENRMIRPKAPTSSALYLSGLVYCGNCGCRMFTGSLRRNTKTPRKDGHQGERYEFFCSSYHKALRSYKALRKRQKDKGKTKPEVKEQPAHEEAKCTCLRNGVFQDVLQVYIDRFLEETGKRLELLTEPLEMKNLLNNLNGHEDEAWRGFCEGIDRISTYLAKYHPDEYNAICEEEVLKQKEDSLIRRSNPTGKGCPKGTLAEHYGEKLKQAVADFKPPPEDDPASILCGHAGACLAAYRANFDPARLTAEIDQLDAEHTRMMEKWAGLTSPLAKEKTAKWIAELDDRIKELRQQQQDISEELTAQYREILDLQQAVAGARKALKGEADERALRHRAEAVRKVIHKVECTFVATGETGSGWGKKNSRLVKVTIHPLVGDSVEFTAESKGTLKYVSAHSLM